MREDQIDCGVWPNKANRWFKIKKFKGERKSVKRVKEEDVVEEPSCNMWDKKWVEISYLILVIISANTKFRKWYETKQYFKKQANCVDRNFITILELPCIVQIKRVT